MVAPIGPRCVECGAGVSGRYCSHCGEAVTHHDYSLKHVAEEALEAVAHVDGRVFSTFRALVLEPGALASNFLAGRRKSQMGPVQLFLVCNVLYFLIQPFSVAAPFTSTLRMQTTLRPWSALARRIVADKIGARHVTPDEYARQFDEAAHLQGKTLVIIMVPIFALGMWALYRRKRFYAEHLVFAFYTYAFMLLWMGVGTIIIKRPILSAFGHGWSGDHIDAAVSTFIAAPFALYLFAALRRTYAESRYLTLLKASLLSVWAVAALTLYRFILFFTTLYAT
jgi:uncharacterized protein DUF3667